MASYASQNTCSKECLDWTLHTVALIIILFTQDLQYYGRTQIKSECFEV